jgi:hypothetical protein
MEEDEFHDNDLPQEVLVRYNIDQYLTQKNNRHRTNQLATQETTTTTASLTLGSTTNDSETQPATQPTPTNNVEHTD